MPLERTTEAVGEALGRAKPAASRAGEQWYELEDANGERVWVRGDELLVAPSPLRVTAIAWHV